MVLDKMIVKNIYELQMWEHQPLIYRTYEKLFQHTAIIFSLTPPMGSTLPVSDISPVMATFWRVGVFIANDNKAVTTAQPALGPSLGVAPCNHRMDGTLNHACVSRDSNDRY